MPQTKLQKQQGVIQRMTDEADRLFTRVLDNVANNRAGNYAIDTTYLDRQSIKIQLLSTKIGDNKLASEWRNRSAYLRHNATTKGYWSKYNAASYYL